MSFACMSLMHALILAVEIHHVDLLRAITQKQNIYYFRCAKKPFIFYFGHFCLVSLCQMFWWCLFSHNENVNVACNTMVKTFITVNTTMFPCIQNQLLSQQNNVSFSFNILLLILNISFLTFQTVGLYQNTGINIIGCYIITISLCHKSYLALPSLQRLTLSHL